MAVVYTFQLPSAACRLLAPNFEQVKDPSYLRTACRKALMQAVADEIEPITSDISDGVESERINLSLPSTEAIAVRRHAKTLGLSDSVICRRLLLAIVSRGAQFVAPDKGPVAEAVRALCTSGLQMSERPEQVQCYENILAACNERQIGFIEAGTGSGKTLATLLAGREILAEKPFARLAIAVPAIALMRQYIREYSQLINAGVSMPALRVVVGRREFVSAHEVTSIATQSPPPENAELALEWVKRNGPPDSAYGHESRWLVSGLRVAAPGFPAEACILPDAPSPNDPGLLSYHQQFEYGDSPLPEMILCTHAMIGVDLRQRQRAINSDVDLREIRKQYQEEIAVHWSAARESDTDDKRNAIAQAKNASEEMHRDLAAATEDKGKLPPYQYLVIDEAHQFEAILSNALSSYVSLSSVVRLLQQYKMLGGQLPATRLKAAQRALQGLQNLGAQGDDTITLNSAGIRGDEGLARLSEIVHIIDELGISKRNKPSSIELMDVGVQLKKSASTLRSAVNSQYGLRGYLRFSPVRQYPQLYVGKPSLNADLSFLWAGLTGAAALSATLYLRRTEGFSSGYIRSILQVPEPRLREFSPLAPTWLYSSVQGLYTPKRKPNTDGRLWLRPPSRRDKLKEKELALATSGWICEVAEAIQNIHATSSGGMLVLMTSYDKALALGAQLQKSLADVLVTATQDVRMDDQRKAFERIARDGKRAIWIATGAAWTGLDLGGHRITNAAGEVVPAGEDNVLVDLVIPQVPFGLNRTITHLHRMQMSPSIPWETLGAAFHLKQGVGRVIRRSGLPANRRIWLLDGRMNDPAFKGIFASIRLMLAGYRHYEINESLEAAA